jgi:hypothetical protein
MRNTSKVLKRGAAEDGEYQLDRSCEKGRRVTKSQVGNKYPTNIKNKEG